MLSTHCGLQVMTKSRVPPHYFHACFRRLTSGEASCQEWDVVAMETQAEMQEVPQLVVAGEVDDGGRHGHDAKHNAQTVKTTEVVVLPSLRGELLTAWVGVRSTET